MFLEKIEKVGSSVDHNRLQNEWKESKKRRDMVIGSKRSNATLLSPASLNQSGSKLTSLSLKSNRGVFAGKAANGESMASINPCKQVKEHIMGPDSGVTFS